MALGLKMLVRALGLVWVGLLALFAWEYTGQRDAVAASNAPSPGPAVAQPRSVPEAPTAGTARVVYQGAVPSAAVAAPPSPSVSAPKAPGRAEPEPRPAAPVQATLPAAPSPPPAAPVQVAGLPDASVAPSAQAAARLDLNTASVTELNGLGAGMIGRAIVAGRPYGTSEDLLSKRVLNRATYARIKDQVAAR
ncbi:MAG TPA: helix-hairpin-helix domain-containing protein [Salinarimonas sp.]|nr:helix-hairpin-helix domain-containing protein [Salinarimonas sp.]